MRSEAMAGADGSPAAALRPAQHSSAGSGQAGTGNELSLLLCLSRLTLRPSDSALLGNLLQREIDWDLLLALAEQHRVLPLLHHHLAADSSRRVPATFQSRLQARFRLNLAANMALAHELVAIIGLFGAERISVLPMKGIPAAIRIYGSMALRATGDLDLLIHRRDLARAVALLRRRGFLPGDSGSAGSAPSRLEVHMFRPADGVLVELRWRITPHYVAGALDLDYLSNRIQPLALMNTTVPDLGDEELLLTLCVHGSKHAWERLMWVCDVAEFVRSHPGLDWDRLAAHAGQLGQSRAVACGLLVAIELLDAPVPAAALQRIEGGDCGREAARRACRSLRGGPLASQSPRYQMLLIESRTGRAGYLLHLLRSKVHLLRPNEHDRAWIALPRLLRFLYYFIRPFRLAAQHLGLPASRAGRPAGTRP